MTKEEVIQLLIQSDLTNLNLGLIGELGAGKTYFVKSLLEQASETLAKEVTSPSFNICNRYEEKNLKVHHFDLYRIESPEELEDIEIYESLDSNLFTVVEWINQFPFLERLCDMILEIEVRNDEIREYHLRKLDEIG